MSAALLAAYVTAAVGIPLPIGFKPHAGEESYPCASCACGCASAEQCWRSCCCHTLAERFAWARAHKVRPPEFAIAEARLSGINLAWLGIPSNRTCCEKVATGSLPPCCQQKAAACGVKSERSCCAPKNVQKTTNGTYHIVAWRALACRGQSMNWLAATPTLIDMRPQLACNVMPLVTWLGPAISETAEAVSTEIILPPPERA